MSLILIIWGLLCFIFLGSPIAYHLYMKNRATKLWELNIDETYEPSISILVPMHNEEKIVRFKLENLYKVKYPAEKVQIIFVNDASTDKTLERIYRFVNSLHGLDVKVLNRTECAGKSNSLNFALKHATGDVIIVSDADCFWPSDILMKALPYLSDTNVGAITGRESLLNPQQSWVTKSELFYDGYVQTIRCGESKFHSTIFFQGGFAAYKRGFLDEFDRETDDSGTTLNIVQKNGRALIIPEAFFYTMFPVSWKNKIVVKMRRASQLQRIWIKCLKLLLKEKLILPKRITIPEIFLHIFNPMVFVALMFATIFLFVEQPVFLLGFLLILSPILLVPKTRIPFMEMVQNNCILLAAMVTNITNKRFKIWRTVEESRSLLNENILKENHLI